MGKVELIEKLVQELDGVASERRAAKMDATMLAARTGLKQYQSDRLARTHADLLGAPDTHGAALFFLEELYGAHDLSQRDADLERIIPTMQRMLNYDALHAITEAIVLDALSERLDSDMARALGPDFSEEQYARAYRTVTTRTDRLRQLALVQALGDALCKLVCIPFLATTLKIMRAPARMAGLGQLQQFLERGFSTFKAMRDAQLFVATIVARERAVLENIFDGRARPFDLP
ncbi:MAG: hypothetical protein V4582_03350 [Pseudomonadota bacterium]